MLHKVNRLISLYCDKPRSFFHGFSLGSWVAQSVKPVNKPPTISNTDKYIIEAQAIMKLLYYDIPCNFLCQDLIL